MGYTDVPKDVKGQPDHESVISAEWTFGAITMCRVLAAQYRNLGNTTYADSLQHDADTMTQAVRYLLLDTSRDDQDLNAYFYANRRYDIPFGWWGNRVDSLTSSAWAVMVANNFHPFVLSGSYLELPGDSDPNNPDPR